MSRTVQSWVRFVVVVILLAATLSLLMARDREEVLPPRQPVSHFSEFYRPMAREGFADQR